MNIIKDFIQPGRRNRPMTYPSSSLYNKKAVHKWITIHNAYSPSWSAKQLHDYVKSVSCANRPASWHFSIDEKSCYQALPLDESGWHAGDNLGPGNTQSIGIEICDYAMLKTPKDEALFWQAVDHAAKLCAYLIETVPSLKQFPDCLKQHNDWSGKNCPSFIRAKKGGWVNFVHMVQEYLKGAPEPDVWYRVIAGSYRDRGNAELMRINLAAQGIGAFIEVKK
jgi:N-acetylmuramoyl-L-alanine amidase